MEHCLLNIDIITVIVNHNPKMCGRFRRTCRYLNTYDKLCTPSVRELIFYKKITLDEVINIGINKFGIVVFGETHQINSNNDNDYTPQSDLRHLMIIDDLKLRHVFIGTKYVGGYQYPHQMILEMIIIELKQLTQNLVIKLSYWKSTMNYINKLEVICMNIMTKNISSF
jgi:hypothetical protein